MMESRSFGMGHPSAPDSGAPNPAPLPATMAGRPFGVDEMGRSVGRTKGNIVAATVTYMLECVEQGAVRALPPGARAEE